MSKELQQRNIKFITGLLICGFSLFLFIAFISYFFQWKQDQIYVYAEASLRSGVFNKSGYYGLLIAHWCVGLYGIGAIFFPIIAFWLGLRIIRPELKSFVKRLVILVAGIIVFSLISVYLLYPFDKSHIWFGSGVGGKHGANIVGSLIENIGAFGTAILLICLTTIYAIYINTNVINYIKQFLSFIYTNIVLFFKYVGRTIASIFKWLFSKNKTVEKPKKVKRVKDVKDNGATIKDPKLDDSFEIILPKEEEFATKTDEEVPLISYNTDGVEMRDIPPVEEIYLSEDLLVGELYDPTKDLSGYQRPPVDLLEEYKSTRDTVNTLELNSNKDKIVSILNNYKIGIEKIFATVGPTVTLYEIVPKDGVRVAQIKRLEDDIALRIAALGVRIIAPIPGKGTVGIEVPNENPDIVSMRSIIKSAKFQDSKFDLPVALGKTILGEVYAFDLAKMPHLLVAGATGQGKSVGLNAILTSLLYKKHPAELKIVMIDPKKVELAPYNKIEKHFLAKLPGSDDAIITDTQKVIHTLKSLCIEMDSRYDLLKIAGVRNVKEYNTKFVNRRLNPEKGHRYMPYIVVIIDEFADLIMTAGREIEEPIARLAQLARAIGIHLVIATQRPTTNIITGLIKANFPARVAFRVTSMIDSRTILDSPGANQLIGRGDMLISTGADLIRVQCAFVDTPEVDRITDFISKQPGYAYAYELPEYENDEEGSAKEIDMRNLDEMFAEAAKLIVISQQGSTSSIQRKLSLGYNRAGRIMDQLEAAGIVGPADGSKPRQVLISDLGSLGLILAAYMK